MSAAAAAASASSDAPSNRSHSQHDEGDDGHDVDAQQLDEAEEQEDEDHEDEEHEDEEHDEQHHHEQQQQHEYDDAEEDEAGQHEYDEGDYDAGSASASAASASHLPIISASEEPVDTSSVYAAFGRDTAAGRALFKLYNKNKTNYAPTATRSALHLRPSDPKAEAEHSKRVAAAALIKPKYKKPTLKKVEPERPVGRVSKYGGKKSSETIDMERARDAHLYKAPRSSPAELKLRSSEEAKRRLQEAMEGAGRPKNQAVPAPLPGRGRMPAPSPSPKDPNQQLSEAIIREIDERHAFLDSMRAKGDTTHEAAVKAEIAARLRDLQQLERIMAEEAEEKAAGTVLPHAPPRAGSGQRRRP